MKYMGFMIIYNIYNHNKKFRKYVIKFCRKHHLSIDEALQNKLVQEVGIQYMKEERSSITEYKEKVIGEE